VTYHATFLQDLIPSQQHPYNWIPSKLHRFTAQEIECDFNSSAMFLSFKYMIWVLLFSASSLEGEDVVRLPLFPGLGDGESTFVGQ
jgi:hypothetical protein